MARDAGTEPERITVDLCVIGAGSGGLSCAAGAAQMGASVALIEGGEMGGDCLNAGCVPSKSLLAAGKHAHAMGAGAAFGVSPARAEVDGERVRAHVRDVIAQIAPHDSQERFEGLGVRVIRGFGRFVSPREVEAAGVRVRARRIVIATGSRPFVPPIEGLDAVSYLTNETVFDLTEVPRRLVVIGGGPIGTELSQAWRRLGAEVVVVEHHRPLGKEDAEAAEVVLARLRAEGVEFRIGARAERVEATPDGLRLTLDDGGSVEGSHLLVAVGRRLTTESLDLAAGGVEAGERGPKLDAGLRSVSNRRVYAVGDAAGGPQFTHLAGYHAGVAIRRALFGLPATARMDHVPRVTYSDPELAQVGATEAAARERVGEGLRVLRVDYAESDRARAERATEGFVKFMADGKGRVLGATIVGARAGELIHIWALAMSAGIKVGAVANMVAPYPTLGELNKRAAGQFYTPKLFGNPWVRRAIKVMTRIR